MTRLDDNLAYLGRSAGSSRFRPRLAIAVAAVVVAACGSPSTPPSATTALGTNAPQSVVASSPIPASPSVSASLSVSDTPSMTLSAPSLALFGAYPAARIKPKTATALQRVLEAALDDGAPDAIAALVTPDGTWSGAAGIGGMDGRKATPTDEFYIASLSKVFTSALVMRLAEQKKIDLDAPLSDYLGDLQVDTNEATVRQALGMMSGLPDYPSDAADAIAADPGHSWTPQELISRFFVPPTDPAGSAYIYGNPGYLLLAIAVEGATGMTYAKALRQQVLDPLGAKRILEQGAGVVTPKPWALPTLDHTGGFKAADYGKGGVISCISSVSFSVGGGALAGDAPSVAAWMWRLLAGEIVDLSSLEEMVPAAGAEHGLGLERLTGFDQPSVFGQTGAKTGYGSILAVFPEQRAVIVLFVNDPDFIVEPTVGALLDTAVQR
jgi:D-alanyl-D-alanine carboxypeptidase